MQKKQRLRNKPAAANQAIQAINAASDQANVDKAQAEGIAAIAAVKPVTKDKGSSIT